VKNKNSWHQLKHLDWFCAVRIQGTSVKRQRQKDQLKRGDVRPWECGDTWSHVEVTSASKVSRDLTVHNIRFGWSRMNCRMTIWNSTQEEFGTIFPYNCNFTVDRPYALVLEPEVSISHKPMMHIAYSPCLRKIYKFPLSSFFFVFWLSLLWRWCIYASCLTRIKCHWLSA